MILKMILNYPSKGCFNVIINGEYNLNASIEVVIELH